jgi:hypothetical protein
MATARAGPLVSSISGSVGGVTFRQGAGGLQVRARTKPTDKLTPLTSTSRALLARASTAWSGLTLAQRQGWVDFATSITTHNRIGAAHKPNGYRLYVGHYMRQFGRTTITNGTPPTILGSMPPISITTIADATNLYVNGFDRNLATGEHALVRVLREYPRTWASPLYKIYRYRDLDAATHLSAYPSCSLTYPTLTANAQYVGTIYNNPTWSFETWFYPTTYTGASLWCLMAMNASTRRINVYESGNMTWWNGPPLSRTICAAPALNNWHHFATVFENIPPAKVTFYLDGAFKITLTEVATDPLINTFSVGKDPNAAYPYKGKIDQVKISTIALSAAAILATWNAGVYTPLPLDANTRALWRAPNWISPTWTDLSPNGFNLTTTDVTQIPGPYAQILYAGADSHLGARRRVCCSTRALRTENTRSLATRAIIDW